MTIEPDYRGHRIEIYAAPAADCWDATVKIRRLFTEEKARVETVTCKSMTAEIAETAAVIWAKRWVDVNLST